MSCCLTSDSIPLIYVYDNSLSGYWNAASPELSAPRQGHTTLFGKRSYQRDRYSEHKGRASYVSVLSSKSLHFWSVFNILSATISKCSPGSSEKDSKFVFCGHPLPSLCLVTCNEGLYPFSSPFHYDLSRKCSRVSPSSCSSL